MQALKIPLLIFILSITISAQDFWQQTNGPYGVPTVYDFLQYNDSTIFLGTNEGIIRSKDNGETWSRIDGQDLNTHIRGITKDHFGTLYAGSYDTEHGFKRLLKSTDEGNTWNQTSFGAEIRCIYIPYKDTIMIGSWDKGVYRSFNGGVTWSRVNNGNIYNGIYEIIQLDDGSVLAGSAGGGVFKTTNWGDLWIPSNTGLPANTQGYRFAKSFCKTIPSCLLVGTTLGIYYSTNNGETWNFKSAGLTDRGINKIVRDENEILYAGVDVNSGVYYSNNGGDYWNYLGLNITTFTLGWDSNSRLYAGGSSAGLYRFVFEDSSWTHIIDQGYNPVEVNHLWITESGNLIANTPSWGLKYTSNGGINWKTINEPAGFYAFETINDSIFVVGGTEHVYVSIDTGRTWSITANYYVFSSFYESANQILYLGTNHASNGICGIYISYNFGFSWELLYVFPSTAFGQMITNLYVTSTNQVMLASVAYNFYPSGNINKLYRSIDNGTTWEIIFEDQYNYVSQIIEDTNFTLFVLAGGKLLVSDDEGITWVTKTIPQTKCLAPGYNGKLYRAYSNQIYYSQDKGSTWIEANNTGLAGISIYDMLINQNNRIYLATTSGVYYGEADSIVVSVDKNKPLKTFSLSQNYPNPFNPTTRIKFTIPTPPVSSPLLKGRTMEGFVTLKVYDLLGRQVTTLVNEEKPAGEYEVEFNATTLPSGIYFYQLKAGQFSETKKMILIK